MNNGIVLGYEKRLKILVCRSTGSADPSAKDAKFARQEQIDDLARRVRAVERHLTVRNVATEGLDSPSAPDQVARETANDNTHPQSIETASLYEGGPSFTHQSIQARDVAQKTAKDTGDLRSDLSTSLNHLETLLHSSVTVSSSDSYHFSGKSDSSESIRPLPMDLVLSIIQEIKSSPLCDRYDLNHYTLQAGANFKAAIETYDVLAVPSFESLFALIMGFTKAQDDARPLLSYTLISAAANHCQMLGYHKESTYRTTRVPTANAENDTDIDVEPPVLSNDATIRPWDRSFLMGIKLARIQGKAYDRLYTSAAMKIDDSERANRIDQLSMDMQQWYFELKQIDSRRVNSATIFELSRDSWDIMYYSTYTSILRAPTTSSGGGEISAQCFSIARLSLQSHLNCFGKYSSSESLTDSDYANWSD
ncbi:hypothetical protein FE257_003913 [Aspergillus nanangensis]|uniref:Uncharacterized protein n=1 Tax=Aspergillus nanangensis TaxID=2582783 RepID=A0AAD4GW26_ASPNN|nr:hypothetical protein FE257_003913 [Aspergillus nanangensis]